LTVPGLVAFVDDVVNLSGSEVNLGLDGQAHKISGSDVSRVVRIQLSEQRQEDKSSLVLAINTAYGNTEVFEVQLASTVVVIGDDLLARFVVDINASILEEQLEFPGGDGTAVVHIDLSEETNYLYLFFGGETVNHFEAEISNWNSRKEKVLH